MQTTYASIRSCFTTHPLPNATNYSLQPLLGPLLALRAKKHMVRWMPIEYDILEG